MSDDAISISPAEFIQTLFGRVTVGHIEMTYLIPDGLNKWPRTVIQWAALPLGEINPDLPNVMEKNAQGYGCYIGVAVRGRKYEPEQRISDKTGRPYLHYQRGKAIDATYITALWVDIDEPGEAGYTRAIGALVPPSIVVATGGGYHAYWLLTEPLPIDDYNRDKVKQTLKGMAIAAGSDPKVAELARILRLPGTVNTKPSRNGARCEVLDFFPAYYHYEQFETAYAKLARPAEPVITRYVPVEASAGLPKWVEDYLNTGAPQGERNSRLYAVARELFDNGYSYADVERLAGGRAAMDGLPDEEIKTAIRSASNAPRNTPHIDRKVSGRMAAADRLLGRKKGAA